MAPQPQRAQHYMHQESVSSIPPPVRTPPTQAFHRSTVIYDGSAHASTVSHQPHHIPRQQPEQGFMEALLAQQHAKAAVMEESRLSQNSPTVTVLSTHSLHAEHQQPLQPSPIPSHNTDQTPNDRLRVNLQWEKTSTLIWLDMSAPAEAFFMTFQQLAEKKKKLFNRADVTICLRKDKLDPDGEEHDLSLDEEELQTDWETTLAWLVENKRDTAPHIFGRVLLENG
jgi:hypothetical protein